jgi:hypothetical protein
MKLRTLAAIGCLGVIVAACGGGSDGGGTVAGGGTNGPSGPTTSVPSSTFASVDAFIAYLRGLAADETSEPLPLPDAAIPTSDTTEPAA